MVQISVSVNSHWVPVVNGYFKTEHWPQTCFRHFQSLNLGSWNVLQAFHSSSIEEFHLVWIQSRVPLEDWGCCKLVERKSLPLLALSTCGCLTDGSGDKEKFAFLGVQAWLVLHSSKSRSPCQYPGTTLSFDPMCLPKATPLLSGLWRLPGRECFIHLPVPQGHRQIVLRICVDEWIPWSPVTRP